MAATASLSLHSPCPTLSSHSPCLNHQLLLSPFSGLPKFNGYSSPTVTSRQNICMLRLCASRNPSSPTFVAMGSVNREPMVPPYNVLITGSSKGIGYALAKEFLKAGDNVLICSRSYERVDTAVQSLRVEFGEQHVALNVM